MQTWKYGDWREDSYISGLGPGPLPGVLYEIEAAGYEIKFIFPIPKGLNSDRSAKPHLWTIISKKKPQSVNG